MNTIAQQSCDESRSGDSRFGIRPRGISAVVAASHPSAFTLIELMVVITLMTIMILGLIAMFVQTQRAFRTGMTQTDILEGGRLVTDMMAREIQQTTPTGLPRDHRNATNFFAAVINSYATPFSLPTPYAPLEQDVIGTPGRPRINVLQDLFFTVRENQQWTGIGYFVRTNAGYPLGWGPVGSLYRFETNNTRFQFEDPSGTLATSLLTTYRTATNGISRLLDGVVHFRVRAYDPDGNWINPDRLDVATNYTGLSYSYTTNDANYFFFSNAVPAFVEIELGLLEDEIYKRYQGIPDVTVAGPAVSPRERFLRDQGTRVHIFRQRIPIRKVDSSVYNETP